MNLLNVSARIAGKLRGLRRPALPADFVADEFDWRTYSSTYRGELADLETTYTARLRTGDAALVDGCLQTVSGVPPLHPNHRLLYETIASLQPREILEAGCGGGDHLHNLSILLPNASVCGFDRASQQLDLLRERNPQLAAAVRTVDLTLPVPADVATVDLVFTQAVLMHIHTGNGHRVALANLFGLARNHVVLMENWLKHDFLADIEALHRAGVIGWREIHPYIRRAPELNDRPHLLVVSAHPVEGMERLQDYRLLTAALAGVGSGT